MPQAHNTGNDSAVAGATVKAALETLSAEIAAITPPVPVVYCYGRFQPNGSNPVTGVTGTHSFTASRSSLGQYSATFTIPAGYAIVGVSVSGNDAGSSDRRFFESGVGLSGVGGVTLTIDLWSYQRTANTQVDIPANANSFIWIEARITAVYP